MRKKKQGLIHTMANFFRVLKDMDKKGETIRTETGKVASPFGSARYKYRVQIGKGFRPGKNEIRRARPKKRESH